MSSVPRLHDWLGDWMIEPTAAQALWAELRHTDWLAHFAAAPQMPAAPGVVLEPGEKGKSVAVVPLVGTLMKSRSSFGGTSTVQARRDIGQAAANPDVSGILLSIDSPGGTVAGTDELGQAVKAARRRKPVFAQINDLGASAAYWVASQASKVYANSPTALVGSIGTLMAVRKDTSGEQEVFTSGPLKAPGATGELSDESRLYFQALVNGWQGHFTAAVKSGRRMTDAQLERVTTGAVFLAGTAGELKLIDGIQSEHATLVELAGTR